MFCPLGDFAGNDFSTPRHARHLRIQVACDDLALDLRQLVCQNIAMFDVVFSLIPVFTLIALGAVLRRFKLLQPDGWAALERLTYFVLFPPLMFMSIMEGSFARGNALLRG